MPLFEYECLSCGKIFEVLTQRANPKARPVCPQCGKAEVERLWSPFATQTSTRGGCATTSAGST